MDECSEPKVKSLAKSLKILSCFTIQEPVLGVTELAERIGVTKSNIHNILSTFTSMGYLDRLPDGRYTLGLKILEYAFIINQNLGYPNAVYDILVDTAGKTNEIVYFGLPYGTNVLYLYVAHPANRMGVLPYRDILGETSPFYCTGIGKAILAHMPEEEWLAHIPAEPAFSPTPSPTWTPSWRSSAAPAGGATPSTTASGTPTCGVWVFLCTTLPASWWPG